MESIKLDGRDVVPAAIEGTADILSTRVYTFVRPRWISDEEAVLCPLCQNKFNQLRRKHHCRQCGRVCCNKCCKERIPLPQLGLEDPERVCESCRPITELITKSRSHLPAFLREAIAGLLGICKCQQNLGEFVSSGGVQTIISLASVDDEVVKNEVVLCLHNLSTHHPLHRFLIKTGAIKTLCRILDTTVDNRNEDIVLAGISALMIFCKSSEFREEALRDGALKTVLHLCPLRSENVALLAVSTLCLIVENQSTHSTVMGSGDHNILSRILSLTNAEDDKMQEVSFKTLAHLSVGSDQYKHRIVQEDFTSGHCLERAFKKVSSNEQILCNAACLVGNLATSSKDQAGLKNLMTLICEKVKDDSMSKGIVSHLSRGIANFSRFPQNAEFLVPYLPIIVEKCLKSTESGTQNHSLRLVFNLLTHLPEQTSRFLITNGASDVFRTIAKCPALTNAIGITLINESSDQAKPP